MTSHYFLNRNTEPSLPRERILQCEGALAPPGRTALGDPEDDEEEEEDKKKKGEEDEDEEENDGEEEEVPWQVATIITSSPHRVASSPC